MPRKKKPSFTQRFKLSGKSSRLIVVALLFGAIGVGYLLYQSSATTVPEYKVRFIAVIPKDQPIPSWATSSKVKSHALSIRDWYTREVGKSFAIDTGDSLNYRVVYGAKTQNDYMKTCPSSWYPCSDNSDRIGSNLKAEFSKPGTSTVIFTPFTPPIDNGVYSVAFPSILASNGTSSSLTPDVEDQGDYVKNSGVVAVQFSGNSSTYIGDTRVRRYAAHELGHTFGLGHTCDYTVMSAGGGKTLNGVACKVATEWPNTKLSSTQASSLRAKSPFFNAVLGDIPVAGDWNGDGITTVGIFRPSEGRFYMRNTNSSGTSDLRFDYGTAGDIPLAGDWNGDGITTIGVKRDNVYRLRNSNSEGPTNQKFSYGKSSDVPLVGDWDGNGTDTIGVYRPSERKFYLSNTNGKSTADISFVYGAVGDRPLAGDWNGDGVTTIGVKRGNYYYLHNVNAGGGAELSFQYGMASDIPLAGDWDRNGTYTIGVFRPSEANFYLRNQNDAASAPDYIFNYGLPLQ